MKRPLIVSAIGLAVLAGVLLAAVPDGDGTDDPAAEIPATSTSAPTTAASDGARNEPAPAPDPAFDRDQLPRDLAVVSEDWATDFSRTTIAYDELLVGIRSLPIRDRIPPIDTPKFVAAAGAEHIAGREPGLSLDIEGDARFYPLSILTQHEIVNDIVGGQPVAVTFCPLCNSAIVFDRAFQGTELRFGVSGLLRNSDLVMWDDLTESLWQQLTGEGLIGEFAGEQLTFVPSSITSFADFTRRYPDGRVLGSDQGFGRRYGFNPYEGYSSRSAPYGFFDQNDLDPRFPALERVINVTIEGTAKAYPFSVLSQVGAVNDTVAGRDVLVLWGGDTADALDAGDIPNAQGIGTGIAFHRVVDGRVLTFSSNGDDTFTDAETGSVWDLTGTALTGELTGARLEPVVHGNEFWFAWAAFNPGAEVYEG
jgi:hypothetical protein